MNPVIYFDELDKLSSGFKGNDIENMLCHLTDFSQNNCFHDKYFSGIDFDLSKVLFIFSYNDESKINPILLDRMYKIKTDGFNTKSKINIAKDYLLPEICKNIGFDINDIIINDDIFKNIIENYTDEEKGVRNLKRCIESIISGVNIMKILKYQPTTMERNYVYSDNEIIKNMLDEIINKAICNSLIENDNCNKSNNEKLKFPFKITDKNINQFLKKENYGKVNMMYL